MEKMAPSKHRLSLAQMHHLASEIEQCALLLGQIPAEPCQGRVLTINVVVTMLRLSKFVACQEHRHTLGKKERGEEITLLPRAQSIDLCVPGFALVSTVPAFVIVRAVAVFFAIRFVMFVIVTDQIANAEAVVRGYEVHARVRTSSVVGVKVATPG